MNLRIIHSNFEINLLDTSFIMVEENNWFSDKMFSKYTYPISKVLSDKEDAALNFISIHVSRGITTVFDVFFYVMNKEHKAVMEIEKIIGRKIEFQVRYGFEEFPNFEKKLAQLPLHKFDLTESIYQHAQGKLALSGEDYNFPRVFTDQFDTESPQWQAFEGSINNYSGSTFLQNEYDAVDDIQLNRNVMQPLPSLLYVLKQGFADKGYTLAGDILEDPEFKDAYIYTLSEYYSTIQDNQKQEMFLNVNQYNGSHPGNSSYKTFYKGLVISEPGRYKIAGNLFLQTPLGDPMVWGLWNGVYVFGNISINATNLGYWRHFGEQEKFVLVDITFDILPGQAPQLLTFSGLAADYRVMGGTRVYDIAMLDLTISQLTKYNPDGSAQPTLVLPNEIDLARCVPDITFGDLYKAIKLWKNYGVDIVENTVYIDLVKNQAGRGPVKKLNHKEVMEPERTFNQGRTFELKFSEISSDQYEFPSLFIDRSGASVLPYVLKSDTEEITIEAIPLPLKTENGTTSAHGFLDDKQRLQLVLYNGLNEGMNTTDDPSQLMIPAIYENYYQEWIDFLLETIGYLWVFNDFDINVEDLRTKTTVFAYGVHHVVHRLSKKNVAPGIIETEIETYSIE